MFVISAALVGWMTHNVFAAIAAGLICTGLVAVVFN